MPDIEMKSLKETAAQIEKCELLREKLKETVVGQNGAIDKFMDSYINSEFFPRKPNRPQASYLFMGPPGVGKTLLASTVAQAIERPMKVFNMGEYPDKDSALNFIGFDSTYKNAKDGLLVEYVRDNPNAVLLFDEIEKACPEIQLLFLQILDGARLRSRFTNEYTSFTDTIIIFTTNAGKDLYEGNENTNLTSLPVETIKKALTNERAFKPELISRFSSGQIILFNHLEAGAKLKIIENSFIQIMNDFSDEYDDIGKINIKNNSNNYVCQSLLMNLGNADARVISAKSEAFFKDICKDLTLKSRELEADDDISIEFACDPLDESVSNADVIRIFPPRFYKTKGHDPINVLYFSVTNKNTKCKQNPWIKIHVVDNEKKLQQAFVENIKYDYAVVDITDKENSYTLSESNEGYRCLLDLIDKTKMPIYLVDTGNIRPEDAINLKKLNIRDFISSDINHSTWYYPAKSAYLVRSLDELTEEEKHLVFDYEVTISGENKLCVHFSKFRLSNVAVADLESRKTDKQNILSYLERPKTRFSDIIGAKDAKLELLDFIEYVKNPDFYEMNGCPVSRGVLLYGDPGTGKTMLAKATAGESGMVFIEKTGSELAMNGPNAVKELFESARRNAPAIIFIDEFDALGKQRTGANDISELACNRLLTEMDGFKTNKKKLVFVIAATNASVDNSDSTIGGSLDQAVLRRFGKSIYVDLPSAEERKEYITKTLSKKGQTVDEFYIDTLVDLTSYKSLAIIENFINYAMRRTIGVVIRQEGKKSKKIKLNGDQLIEYYQEFCDGEKNESPDENEIRKVAIHEAGHAFLNIYNGEEASILSISPRSNYGGYVKTKNRMTNYTFEDYLGSIRTSFAGRAAEVEFFGEEGINEGASSDLRHATYFAKIMTMKLGMGNRLFVTDSLDHETLDLIEHILKTQYALTREIIKKNRIIIETIADEVCKSAYMYLTGNEIKEICNRFKITRI